jgi:hypothetical protein
MQGSKRFIEAVFDNEQEIEDVVIENAEAIIQSNDFTLL